MSERECKLDIHVRAEFISTHGRRIPIVCTFWLKREENSCNVSRTNGILVFQSLKFSLKTPCVPLLLILKYKYILNAIKKKCLCFLSIFSQTSVSHTVVFKEDAEGMVACSFV